jgi:hypothetical protein
MRYSLAALAILLLHLFSVVPAGAQSCGDPDGDGVVAMSDAHIIARQAVNLPSKCSADLAVCDLNGDGVITAVDVVRAMRLALGVDTANMDAQCPIGGQ